MNVSYYPIWYIYIYIIYIYIHTYIYIYICIYTIQVSNIALKSIHQRCSTRKAVLQNLAKLIEKYLCWSLFLINLQAYKPPTLLQRDSNTGVFLWILRKFWKPLFQRASVNNCFWTLLIQCGRNNRKNRDVSRDDNQRRIQNPVKHLKWSILEK